jgi:hypothetical protein
MFSVSDGSSLLSKSSLVWFNNSPVFYRSVSSFLSSVLLLAAVKGLAKVSRPLLDDVSLVFSPLKVLEDLRFYS